MISPEARQRFISIVGQESYYDSKADLLAYSYDATPGFQALPDAVLAPSCTEDVKKL